MTLDSYSSYSKTPRIGVLVAGNSPETTTNDRETGFLNKNLCCGIKLIAETRFLAQDMGAHQHKRIEIPPSQPIPTVNLVVHPDKMQGWNLEVKLTNFRFAPERVNTNSVTTEGHAHLYIDGKKVTRLYSSWYYLSSLERGQHKITVTLNANGHEELVHNGKPISATAMVDVL